MLLLLWFFFSSYVVDIEIGRDMVYFSVGNMEKMGVGGLGSSEMQSLGSKRHRFSYYNLFLFIFNSNN